MVVLQVPLFATVAANCTVRMRSAPFSFITELIELASCTLELSLVLLSGTILAVVQTQGFFLQYSRNFLQQDIDVCMIWIQTSEQEIQSIVFSSNPRTAASANVEDPPRSRLVNVQRFSYSACPRTSQWSFFTKTGTMPRQNVTNTCKCRHQV